MTKQANIKTAPEVEASVEDAYRRGLGYNETARVLDVSSTTVRRIVRDCPGLARSRTEQLRITLKRRKKEMRTEQPFSLNAMGYTRAGKCVGCKMDFVVPIAIGDGSVVACPLCVYGRKARRAGDTRPLFWERR